MTVDHGDSTHMEQYVWLKSLSFAVLPSLPDTRQRNIFSNQLMSLPAGIFDSLTALENL